MRLYHHLNIRLRPASLMLKSDLIRKRVLPGAIHQVLNDFVLKINKLQQNRTVLIKAKFMV